MLSNNLMLAVGTSSAVELSFDGSHISGTNTSTYTFSAAAPAANATDIVVVTIFGGTETRTVSSVTVDGNAMSLIVASNGVEACAIYAYAGSTSTSGNIVVSWSNNQGRCGIGVYVLSNASVTASDTATTTDTSGAITTTIDCPANGCIIGVVGCRSGNDSDPAEFSWSGITENYDEQVENGNDASQTGASDIFMVAQTALSISCTPNRSYVAGRMALASFGPA
jgi:hypothetical protein